MMGLWAPPFLSFVTINNNNRETRNPALHVLRYFLSGVPGPERNEKKKKKK